MLSRPLLRLVGRTARTSCLRRLGAAPVTHRAFSTTTTVATGEIKFDPTQPIISTEAVYHKHGSVLDSLVLEERQLKPATELGPTEVLLQMLAAPINPADFNMIEGVYSIRPELPAIGGNEGCAEVLAVGSDVKLSVGDWVIPRKPGFGTWRSYAICDESELSWMVNDIECEYAASLAVNPCTAYRILQDFIDLKPGDVIIQNGANSAVGHAVIQLARDMGVKTINIIRHREDVDILIHDLKALGADHVLVDTAIPESLKGLDVAAPVLGLNCVGGRSSMSIARLLADDSCMVTYGGMSRKPVQVPTGKLIFNDISARGFWLSRWTQKHSEQERMDMIKDLGKMVADGRMKYPMEFFSFGNNFHDAIIRARQGFRSKKVLFKFGNNKRNVDYL